MTASESRAKYRARKYAEYDALPKIPCACGCGTMIAPIGKHGKPVKYKLGHNTSRPRQKPKRITLTCEQCGNEFIIDPGHASQRFCSTVCVGESRKLPVTLTCQRCNEKFTVAPWEASWRKYCSKDCHYKERDWSPPVILKCEYCGNEFTIPTWIARKQNQKYCSRECSNKGRTGKPLSQPRGRPKVTLTCQHCDKPFIVHACYSHRKCCSRECAIAERPSMAGANNPAWNGGTSFEPYNPEFNDDLRRSIRKRDNYTCQSCGITQDNNGIALDVHHIDFDKKNSNPNNLISLCRSCHAWYNTHRDKSPLDA